MAKLLAQPGCSTFGMRYDRVASELASGLLALELTSTECAAGMRNPECGIPAREITQRGENMRVEDLRRYIKNTEKMVVPEKVATTTMGGALLRKLPLRLQRYIVNRGARTNPYMSFVVEPYAVFLAFEIVDTEAAERLLPPNYSLFPSAMFSDTPTRPCAIISAFNVHTNVFWGSRVEFYLIAENCKTGLLSWIIERVREQHAQLRPEPGLHRPEHVAFGGHDVVRGRGHRRCGERAVGNSLALVADLNNGVLTELDQRLWVEGNLSVDYGGELQQCTKPFSLVFDPKEMARALEAPARRHLAVHQHVRRRHAGSDAVRGGLFPVRAALRHDERPDRHHDADG